MNQKRNIAIFIIVGFVIVGLAGYYAYAKLGKKTDSQDPTPNTSQEEQEDLGTFSTDKKEKPLNGDQNKLLDMNLEYASNYDRVVFAFASNPTGQAPGYIAELDGNIITIRFYDTRDVDSNLQKIYEGESKITGEGKIIEKVELWYPQDDSSIGVKIYLDSSKGFRITEDGLFLTLDVECGCGLSD